MNIETFKSRIANCCNVTLRQYDDDLEDHELCDEVVDRMIQFMPDSMSVENLRDLVEDVASELF